MQRHSRSRASHAALDLNAAALDTAHSAVATGFPHALTRAGQITVEQRTLLTAAHLNRDRRRYPVTHPVPVFQQDTAVVRAEPFCQLLAEWAGGAAQGSAAKHELAALDEWQ